MINVFNNTWSVKFFFHTLQITRRSYFVHIIQRILFYISLFDLEYDTGILPDSVSNYYYFILIFIVITVDCRLSIDDVPWPTSSDS